MKDLRLVNTVERVIMEVDNLSVKNVLMFNNRNKEDYKLNPVTDRKWNSNKYKQDTELHTLTFRSSDYLVFGYRDWNTGCNNQIFVSYPNMYYLKIFIDKCMELLMKEDLYGKDDVNPDYKSVIIESEPLAGGKKLGAFPSKIARGEYLVDAITLIIGNNDCLADIDTNTFAALADIISSFDLFTVSNQTYQMALTVAYSGNNTDNFTSSSNNNSRGFNTSNTPRRQIPNNGLRSRQTTNFNTRRQEPVVNKTNNQSIDTDISKIPDSEVPFTVSEDTSTVDPDIFSTKNIMEAGGESDLDSINLDADDELDF